MAQDHCTQANTPVQPPKYGFKFLKAALDGLDLEPIIHVIRLRRWTGRPGYPIRAMLRLYLAKFLLNIPHNNQLLDRFRQSPELREICGLEDDVPSESALSRFASRLTEYQALVKQCLATATEELRDLVPAVKTRKGRQDQPLPPLGEIVAIDSTLFKAHANPYRKPVADPDANWGAKHSSRTRGDETVMEFGYKMHLLSDATHGVPLDFIITPANANDSVTLPTVLKKSLNTFSWLQPSVLLADRGYDSLENHQFVLKQEIAPVIHIRKPTAKDGLYDGIYDKDGRPTCAGGQPMEYLRTDPNTGEHLFRCGPEGCPLKANGTKAITHCDTEVWESPDTNPRVLGPIPRFTDAWARLYSLRMSIERIFRSMKHSRGLEGHWLLGIRKITLQATLSVLTYQATILARLKAGETKRMRRMTIQAG